MGVIENTKNLAISLAYYIVICLFFLFRNLISKRFHHTKCTKIEDNGVIVWIIPSLLDNYSYLIIDESTKQACAVDAVDPTQLLSILKREGATLQYILTTHHHWDHSGGNHELSLRLWNSHPRIVGSELDQHRIPAINYPVKHDQEISLGSLKIKTLWTPCHTKGHLVYHIESKTSSLLFTGDTLFIGGCGKFFEGSGAEMYHSLINVIGKLPLETKIFCGHEYTVKNLEFASSIEPTNEAITAKLGWAKEQRKKELPTVPSTVSEELMFNPFMRCETMKQNLNCATGTEALTKLRKMKDDWTPPTPSKRE